MGVFKILSGGSRPSISPKFFSGGGHSKNISPRFCSGGSSDASVTKSTRHPLEPDPFNFEILRHTEIGEYLVLEIKYPDCTNFEGQKIVVYENVTLEEAKSWKSLDPHFFEETNCPIARFKPTNDGWNNAVLFVAVKRSLK